VYDPAAVPIFVYPLIVLGAVLLLFAVFAFLARFRGGKYLRPLVTTLAKVPFVRKLMTKASAAALERQNPDLASALKKLEKVGATRDPLQAQRALSRLTPAERDAYFEAVGDQGTMQQAASNRTERRRLEKMQQPARKRSGGGGKRKRR
jgi:hypothetical protein